MRLRESLALYKSFNILCFKCNVQKLNEKSEGHLFRRLETEWCVYSMSVTFGRFLRVNLQRVRLQGGGEP